MISICLNRFPFSTEPEKLKQIYIFAHFLLLIEQNNLISYSEAAKALC